jgi:hypothetical protein
VHQIWANLPKGSRSLQGRQTMNFVDRACENCDRLTVYSAFLGKIVQEFVQPGFRLHEPPDMSDSLSRKP